MTAIRKRVPEMSFPIRVETDTSPGWEWDSLTYDQVFKGKKVLVFSLPGAYTPTCTNNQLPGYEAMYDKFKDEGIDEIYCISVNDSYVMNAWADRMNIQNVKMIPDGSGNFTRFMGMLIGKNHLGFGNRSWRYMAVVNDGAVEKWWQEPGINNEGTDDDPYVESTPDNMIGYLKEAHETGSYGDYSGIDHNKA